MPKILLIEDDEKIVKMYERVFVLEGFTVSTAFDGDEGLQKAKEEKPDLILLDIMMPKRNGMDVLLKLKCSTDETKNIPVIVLTNLAGIKEAQSAYYIGAVKYLIKSDYEPKQVTDIVKKVLSKTNQSEHTTSDNTTTL